MRLVDADELKKDDEVTMWLSNDAIRTGKQLKMFSEYFINKIDNMPTVQAVPIDVLDKIRTEIEKAVWEDIVVSLDGTDEIRIPRLDPDDVFEIIDRYRAESEEE